MSRLDGRQPPARLDRELGLSVLSSCHCGNTVVELRDPQARALAQRHVDVNVLVNYAGFGANGTIAELGAPPHP